MKSALKTTLTLFGFIFAISASYAANAASVVQFSPQGEIAQVRQVKARFSEAAVAFGDPKAASPLILSVLRPAVDVGRMKNLGV